MPSDEAFEALAKVCRASIDIAGAAAVTVVALELRVATLERALSQKPLAEQFEMMAELVVKEMRPSVERVLKLAEQTFRRNAELSDALTTPRTMQ